MAAINSGSGTSFYSPVGGLFRKRATEDAPGAVKRENKNGETVYELCYDTLRGQIIDIKINDLDFGRYINISLADGDVLSIPFEGSSGAAFIKMLPNIDEKKETEFNTFVGKDGKIAFIVKQGGQALKWAFTRENPNGMPDPIEKTIAGKTKWDFSDQEDFLYNLLLKEADRFNVGIAPATADDFKEISKPEIEDLPF